MMQSLDGYIAGPETGPHLPAPGPELHQFFNDRVRGLGGMIFGTKMYEVMRFWDGDFSGAEAIEADFAAAWRRTPKWVASNSLREVGPNATLVKGDLASEVTRLKAERDGELEVAGPELAASLTDLRLIDEYWLYFLPVVLGAGKPYFARPPAFGLEWLGTDHLPENTICLRYRPADVA